MPSLKTILDGIAYQLWDSAFQKHVDGMHQTPKVPAAAKRAASDLERLYLSMNKARGATLNEIMRGPVGRSVPGAGARRDAGYFGVLLAENALESDGYKELGGGLAIPFFKVEFDGDEFTWEGSGSHSAAGAQKRPPCPACGKALPADGHCVRCEMNYLDDGGFD